MSRRRSWLSAIVLCLVFVVCAAAAILRPAAQQVVPGAYQATTGTGTFLGPLSNAPRTYQLLVHQDQLAGLAGQYFTAISWRLPASAGAPFPAADTTYTNYDLYLSGSVEPAARSLTFASNIVGPQTQVRSGPLVITAGSYPSGGSPNAFGPEITFTTPWLYTGGHVLLEFRHVASNGASSSVDALLTATPGYGTQFSACWTGNYTGTSGSQGNFVITRFTHLPPVAANVSLGGRVASANGRGLSKVSVTLSGGGLAAPRYALTNPFGYYSFDELPAGHTYVVTVASKTHTFAVPSRTVNLLDSISNVDFVAEP